MKIDSETRNALVSVVMEANEMYNEVYVTSQELCNQISMITPDWLKAYAKKLPREQIGVKGEDGKVRTTRWGYPIHKIKRLIAEGKLREL